MASSQKLIIIDGHALAFRSFHGLAKVGLRNSQGEPTYAVFGFTNILLNILQEHQPDYIAVAFDIGRTFRHEKYPDYKANRAKTPEEFHPQLERIKQIVQSLGIPIYTAEHYEADDVIGTLAQQATTKDIHTIILTGDTDTLQLVDDHVQVLIANPFSKKMESTLYNEEKVRERYKGLAPSQLTDLRGLKGDQSDNIPGVKGIGETGAITLLNQFGTIEKLYQNLDEVPKRYRKSLDGQQDAANASKELAVIVCDVPAVTLNVEESRVGEYERDIAVRLFQELEFASLVEKLPKPRRKSHHLSQMNMFGVAEEETLITGDPTMAALGNYEAVVTAEQLQQVTAALAKADGFAFDTECNSLYPFQADLVGISLSVESGKAWYIPVGHRAGGEQLPLDTVLDTLRPFFTDPHKQRFAHNAKFDIEVLQTAGIDVHSIAFDTMIAAGLLGKRMGLKDLAFYELKLPTPMKGIETLIGRGAKQVTFDYVPIEQATPYAAADADMTLRLVAPLQEELNAAGNERIKWVFETLEMPLIPVIVDMEATGIMLDVEYMRSLSKEIQQQISIVEKQIYEIAGKPFNINSSIQLNDILFGKLGLPTEGLSKTSSGRYSLAADALEKMRGSHEIMQFILDYRHLSKLSSTYVDVLPTLINPTTKRIHTSFNQVGTSTGRLASSSPNLQNIPVRTEIGNAIRRGFVASPGCTFVAADYSQIELRVLAHITQDENLVQAFQDGQDIHAAMASRLFHVPIDEVDKQQRRMAKMTVFGIIYGISSFGLAQRTDLSRGEAQKLIDAFFARFPGVQHYMDTTLEKGRTEGYVESFFGRRRFMPDLQTKGPRRQAAEREAINMPIQATAADIMKMAMIQVASALETKKAKLVLQVHDELIFDTPLEEVEEVQQIVRSCMEQAYTLYVPLKVDIEAGANWEHMETVKQ